MTDGTIHDRIIFRFNPFHGRFGTNEEEVMYTAVFFAIGTVIAVLIATQASLFVGAGFWLIMLVLLALSSDN